MTETVTRAGWQQLTAELLERYRGELARHGIHLGPDLHLEADDSTPYSYCDLATGRSGRPAPAALPVHLAHRVWERHAPPLPGPAAVSGAPMPDRPLLPAERALALLDTDLFGSHGSQALLGIAEAFVTRFYPAGAPLAGAGDGAVLGDTECLLGRPWREPVTAASPCVTLEAGHEDFQRLLYALVDLPFHLARRQGRRLSLG